MSGVDPELRTYLAAMFSGVHAQLREMRDEMAAMESRLNDNIQSRRQDIDAAFGDLDALRRRVRELQGHVSLLEKPPA